jgi:hypothetical protein
MTVQNIVPYEKYVTSGSDSVYTVSYYVEDKDNLLIKLNDEVVSKNEYNYIKSSNAIQFNTRLLANQKLEIFRKTKLERATNFESYNNTLRPEVLNKDLDKIWLNLQEQSHKVDQYDLNYDYAVHTSTQALTEVKTAQTRADQAYILADLTNTETRSIEYGGTGATTAQNARTNLNVHSKEEVVALIQTGGEGNIVGVSAGGTGATTATDARTNLNIYSKEEVDAKAALPTGFIQWLPIDRSKIEDGKLALDGQLVSRTTYPELWAKVQSGACGRMVTDAQWLLTSGVNRACYSSGNGSATFRLPDLNGVQTNSNKSPVLRGDGYTASGTVLSDAIRNITGSMTVYTSFASVMNKTTGAFTIEDGGGNGESSVLQSTCPRYVFNASNVVPTSDENRPNSAFGIYLVIAKGKTENAPSSGIYPTLTGGNTWNGTQAVTGNLSVSGTFNADIKSLLNATGAAPIFACRAWVHFNGTGSVAILGSGNVSSITDNGVGDYTVNYTVALPDTNYAIKSSSTEYSDGTPISVSLRMSGTAPLLKTSTATRISTRSAYNGAFLDVNNISLEATR